jgi:hypothetical protein
LAEHADILGENLVQYHFVHHKSHMNWLVSNLGHCYEEPAIKPLSYSTAYDELLLRTRTWDRLHRIKGKSPRSRAKPCAPQNVLAGEGSSVKRNAQRKREEIPLSGWISQGRITCST